MSKKMSYLLGIALTILLGCILYSKYCCNSNVDVPQGDLSVVAPVAPVVPVETAVQNEVKTDSVAPPAEDWAAMKERINAEPLIIYFNSAASNKELTAEEKQKVADLANYVKNVPDAALQVVGHSDNVGKSQPNYVLGQNRADFAKNFLSQNGIDASKVSTDSKGPDEPQADNATEEGKAKNRRAVITIK